MRRCEALNDWIIQIVQNLIKILKNQFFRPHTPTYSNGGEIWREESTFPLVNSFMPNITPIGAVCRPCGEKSLKIAVLVTELNTAAARPALPAMLVVIK